MQEFFNNLYSIENFTLYLIIAIGVLVVLFILVLFLGKKDQKIEETKRLEKLSLTDNGFKEEKTEVKAEAKTVEKKKEDVDILLPPIPSAKDIEVKQEEVVPVANIEEEKEEVKIEEKPVEEQPVKEEVKPILDVIKPDPIVVEEKTEVKIEKPVEDKEPEVVIDKEIKLPDLNFDDVISELNTDKEEVKKEETTFKKSEVFSSVYAPKKEEVIDLTNFSKDNDVPIDLPKKKENVEENKSFDFQNISGETYNIDK